MSEESQGIQLCAAARTKLEFAVPSWNSQCDNVQQFWLVHFQWQQKQQSEKYVINAMSVHLTKN